MKKKHISTIIIALIFLAGLGFLLYPTVSNLWNRAHQSRAIATYTKQVEKLDDSQNKEMLKAARKYNKSLLKKSDHWKLSKKDKKKYESLLDVSGTGIMGYIEVPKIDCSLPIYHGTDEGALQIAIGHLEGSSLPVGGKSTHCVLSGHRGLPSARLFTDLDQMEEGDIFVLNVLGRKLAYEVDQIKVVLPDEMSDLEIVQGKDLCTLVTCTPYGINTHRLLVRGHRTKYIEETVVRVQKEAEKKETGIWLLAGGGAVFLIIIIIVVVKRRRKRRNLQR
ncbi:class C sortase [Blautia luti]|uniref:Class C sortase n=1 Tax=Blautia luti DSM 14534 = JCM 17040 TaxID=649762 RepID=A0A844GF45_9FIRM|nr:class C sortase [Blautia luti]MTD59812.1 class C sortase [Blautia luti DSM 14534 = JCM 17040]BEI62066.1 class C sortase [Blautia luti]